MAALLKCTSIHGGQTVLEADPAILSLNDVIYVPFENPHSQAGLFDHGQKMILQSWYFRGVNPLGGHGNLGTPLEYATLRAVAPEPLYIYGGWLHHHFGHFLLSTLSRFWSRDWERYPNAKILVHAHEDLDWWFGRSWFGSLMSGLGLTRNRFVCFNEPTAIRRIVIPAPAFQEEGFAHRAFTRFCNQLGRDLAGDRITAPDNRPVYLSKERLTEGVQRLENEHEITAVLERNGVEILYPETFSIKDQAALWHNRPFVASFTNSSLHASVLAPGRHIVGLSYGPTIRSNYTLIDEANNTDALYLYPTDDSFVSTGAGNGFVTNHMAKQPVQVAEHLLRAIDFQQRTVASRAGESFTNERRYWSFVPTRPPAAPDGRLVVNLALDKPVRQSSAAPWALNLFPNANSGVLTGLYQFHTDLEQDPWWEVDLLAPALLRQVRLFNRLDNSAERCDCFEISVRTEDLGPSETVYQQEEPIVFGGLDGEAFNWTPDAPVEARFVRITLKGHSFLHLDQVEILGTPQLPQFGTAPA